MHYKFPKITHINDVLPAIEGRDEFIVAQKDGYQVVNYVVMMEDSFPAVEDVNSAIRRECRGLVFNLEGNLINRRYHKFFNVNERDETRFEKVDFTQPHVILDKLDGSMVSPCYINGNIRWMTKMGVTDTSMQAEVFVALRPDYVELAKDYLDSGYTPVFEWCSRKQRIVVDYLEDQLVLTAMRDIYSGNYLLQDELERVGERYGIPVVKAYDYQAENIIDIVRGLEDAEGVVVRFDTGYMLKVKADWYVLRHKSKDAITREKNVLDYIVNDRVDDVLPFLQVEDHVRLLKFQDQFWRGVKENVVIYERYWNTVVASGLDRKAYALNWKPTIEKQDSFAPNYVFGRFSGRDGLQMIKDEISKNIGTQTRIDGVRHLWGGHLWDYTFEGDV